MNRHLRRTATITAWLAGVFVLASPISAARASCAPPLVIADAVAQSDVVVVGTVTATRSRDRIASVRVEESWKGNAKGDFEVQGGPANDNEATSVDRTYAVGTRYLLFAYEPASHGSPSTFGGKYEDNNCSATQTWNSSLSAFRPPGVSAHRASVPTPRGDNDSTKSWLLGAALAAAAIAGTALAISRVRRRAAA